jgi:hypothetical protein
MNHFQDSINMKKSFLSAKGVFTTLSIIALIILAGCSNKEIVTTCLSGHTYGFWGGLWHGIIAPVDLVIMLFRDDFTVYASNTNGAWYAFGFVIGSGGWGFLGGHRASKSYRKRRQ